MSIQYLSQDWIDAVAQAIEHNSSVEEVALANEISVTQKITGTPQGDVTYHLISKGGRVSFGKGAASSSDIAFSQDWTTAVGIATGQLNAQEAFISGKISFKGDHEKVISTQPLFLALDEVFSEVNSATRFD